MSERDSISASAEKLGQWLSEHGCYQIERHPRVRDLSGEKYGRLVAVARVMSPKGKAWLFQCDCGILKVIPHSHDVVNGKVMSCGCWNRQAASRNGKRRRIHGHKGDGSKPASKAYRCWCSMKQRCLYKKHKTYKDYGARGITVCNRWLIFSNFLADMGEPPSDKHSLDRFPNRQGNYEPGNVRWATPKEQGRNQKKNRSLVAFGEIKCISEWAEDSRCAVSEDTLGSRLRNGWSPERALTTPALSTNEVIAIAQAARWPKR